MVPFGQDLKFLNAANFHTEVNADNADVHLVLDSGGELDFKGEFAKEVIAEDMITLYFNGTVQRSATLQLMTHRGQDFSIAVAQYGAWEGRIIKIGEVEGYTRRQSFNGRAVYYLEKPTEIAPPTHGSKRRHEDVASSLEMSSHKHQKQVADGKVSNDWWRGLDEGWFKLDATTLQAKIQFCKSAPRNKTDPIKTPSLPAKRGRGRPRREDKPVIAYCPHCLWLKNRQSFSGRKGRKGNARHGCEWCKIWTKEADDANYVLTPADKKVIRAEDEEFVCGVLVREIAAANVEAWEKAEEAKKHMEDKAKEMVEVKEVYIEEHLVRDSDRTSEGTTGASAETGSEEE